MSDRDTLVFADRDTLFPGPVVDGFFDRDYMITDEAVETGYVGGSQLTMGSSGVPPVIFQGVRVAADDRLLLAFLCRFTQPLGSGANTIDDDEILIAIKSSFASASAADVRLILINPVGSGGAEGGAGVAGSTGAANDIRNNRVPRQALYYKSDGAGSWITASPTNIDVKVRSWNPSPGLGADELAWSVEVSIPRTAAAGGGSSNWIDIQNDFGLYFALTKIVGVGGGMASQYIFPIGSPSFPGFYDTNPLSDFPFGHGLIPGVAAPPITTPATGVYFMGGPSNGWQSIGQRPVGSASLAPGDQIQAANNEMVAILGNDGTTAASQVQIEFAMAHWGLPPADPSLWTRPDGLLPQKIPAGGQTVGAGAINVEFKSDPWTLDNATPNYKGSGLTQRQFFQAHPHQCIWVHASALTAGVNFKQSSVRRNMNFVGLSDVERDVVVSGEGYEEPPNGKDEHDFVLQTFCRKMIIQEVIKNAEKVEDETKQLLGTAIQATGREAAAGADMMLNHVASRRAAATQYRDVVVYVWITMGYRITGETVTVAGKQYPLLDNGCGSFGFVATHTGAADNFSWSFSGAGMGSFSPGTYGLKVPHQGSVTIKTRLSAEPQGPKGDNSRELPKLDPKEWVPSKGGGKPGGGNRISCLGLILMIVVGGAGLATMFA